MKGILSCPFCNGKKIEFKGYSLNYIYKKVHNHFLAHGMPDEPALELAFRWLIEEEKRTREEKDKKKYKTK